MFLRLAAPLFDAVSNPLYYGFASVCCVVVGSLVGGPSRMVSLGNLMGGLGFRKSRSAGGSSLFRPVAHGGGSPLVCA